MCWERKMLLLLMVICCECLLTFKIVRHDSRERSHKEDVTKNIGLNSYLWCLRWKADALLLINHWCHNFPDAEEELKYFDTFQISSRCLQFIMFALMERSEIEPRFKRFKKMLANHSRQHENSQTFYLNHNKISNLQKLYSTSPQFQTWRKHNADYRHFLLPIAYLLIMQIFLRNIVIISSWKINFQALRNIANAN